MLFQNFNEEMRFWSITFMRRCGRTRIYRVSSDCEIYPIYPKSDTSEFYCFAPWGPKISSIISDISEFYCNTNIIANIFLMLFSNFNEEIREFGPLLLWEDISWNFCENFKTNHYSIFKCQIHFVVRNPDTEAEPCMRQLRGLDSGLIHVAIAMKLSDSFLILLKFISIWIFVNLK